MKKRLLYIIGITAAMLTSCSDEVMEHFDFLEGNEKTPIIVVSNISANNPVTRAVDAEFEANDLLNAYIKHVTVADAAVDPLVWATDVTGSGVGPRLANFKVSALTEGHKNEADNWQDHTTTSSTLQVTDAEGLYWDDFSNSASDATDLRTSKHALMIYYGYGYNGSPAYGQTDSSISTALVENTGVLGWKVATDQTSGFKTSDLLYAGQQTPVAYTHGTNNTIDGRDRVLTIPYTHAMSKVTIEVICDEGFEADQTKNFDNAAVKLYQAGTVATVTGPTKEVSKGTTPADINMQKLTPTDATHCSFSGLMAPTLVKAGETFATIEGVDGNSYKVILSDDAIDAKEGSPAVTKTNAWSTQLVTYDAITVTPDATASYTPANGGLTKPGVHYMLTVTIKKQQIKVKATIKDWTAVSAEGEGQILFDNDINTTGDIADGLKTNGFDLYKSTTTTFGTKATTVSWNTGTSKWEYSPKIYWQDKDDAEYFRALSGAVADDAATADVNESLAMTQGCDVLWGTAPAHSGTDVNGNTYNYTKSDKINPRTGDVPLEFEHAMTKISVILSSSGDNAVNLSGARVDIINAYNEGKLDLNTGDISDFSLNLTSPAVFTLSETVNGEFKLLNQIVIPQSLTQDKNGSARENTPAFYQSSELTKIYDDGTSLETGGGSGTYYLTSTLDRENHTEETATTYNANLPGAVSTSTVKTPAVLYTYEEYIALDGNSDVTQDQFNELADLDKTKTAAVNYTADEAKVYNAALPGAVKEGDFHYYKTKDGSEQHTPGELKSQGDKIMMYITLTDGTRYSIELSKCNVKDSATPITEWKRGEHYTYEISLGKEEITFRALIKDWVEKTGSGNATLDWD